LYSLSEDKNQTIEVGLDSDCLVLADSQQVQRVIKNIVHNGIKFAPHGGHIKIDAHISSSDEEVTIVITNNGPGIPREDIPRLFERFYQADRARSDGTGLGLAIARHIILSHGGRIWAESPQGEGAQFFFTLPLSDTQPEMIG
jgi:signal transduction histidine kinase